MVCGRRYSETSDLTRSSSETVAVSQGSRKHWDALSLLFPSLPFPSLRSLPFPSLPFSSFDPCTLQGQHTRPERWMGRTCLALHIHPDVFSGKATETRRVAGYPIGTFKRLWTDWTGDGGGILEVRREVRCPTKVLDVAASEPRVVAARGGGQACRPVRSSVQLHGSALCVSPEWWQPGLQI